MLWFEAIELDLHGCDMSQPEKIKVIPLSGGRGISYWFWCPGCEEPHRFDVRTDGQSPNWQFDGNLLSPTFSPSLFYPRRVCHLFLRNGIIQFLDDCTHKLKGTSVQLESSSKLDDFFR